MVMNLHLNMIIFTYTSVWRSDVFPVAKRRRQTIRVFLYILLTLLRQSKGCTTLIYTVLCAHKTTSYNPKTTAKSQSDKENWKAVSVTPFDVNNRQFSAVWSIQFSEGTVNSIIAHFVR